MINILLCAEGVTEYGHIEYLHGTPIQREGVLQKLMRNCVAVPLSFVVKKRADVKAFKVLVRTNPTAARLAGIAQKENCTHIAYHRDEDNKVSRTNAENRRIGRFNVAKLTSVP